MCDYHYHNYRACSFSPKNSWTLCQVLIYHWVFGQVKKEQWEERLVSTGGISGRFFSLQENTFAISPIRLCVPPPPLPWHPKPLLPGIPKPHLHTEVWTWDLSLLLRCGNLLGQKAVSSNHDVVCREPAWIQYKANSKQFLLEPATGRIDFFINRPRELERKNTSVVRCLPNMLKALGSTPSTAETKRRAGRNESRTDTE